MEMITVKPAIIAAVRGLSLIPLYPPIKPIATINKTKITA